MLLCSGAVRVSPDRSVDALVRGHIVVFPYSDHLRPVGLPATHESSAMAELNRQEIGVEEVVKGGKPFRHRGVATNAVDHERTIDASGRPLLLYDGRAVWRPGAADAQERHPAEAAATYDFALISPLPGQTQAAGGV